MKERSLVLVFLFAAGMCPNVLYSQASPSDSIRGILDATESRSTSPPGWMLWQAFHSSMASYFSTSPADVYAMLGETAGLTPQDVAVLLNLGSQYLTRMSDIHRAAASDVEARRNELLTREAIDAASQGGAPTIKDSSGRTLVDMTQVLRETLANDGVITRVEQQRDAAHQMHLRDLALALGEQKLSAIDHLIQERVAGAITIFDSPRIDVPSPLERRDL